MKALIANFSFVFKSCHLQWVYDLDHMSK